ncbi:hypothetical protein GI582_18055 [Sulfitobacter sp. BDSS02]|nr:hypothetical protein [Sulfitobacter sp. BDSS02]MBR9852034.1 hypothetical protein [Paracoccaceae bacterium]
MSDLTTRRDDKSIQITAEDSARFFVRVTSSVSNNTKIVFSDFILNPDDEARAVDALHLLKKDGFPFSPAVKLVFQDIHPSYADDGDRTELVRRHDQIVAVVKNFAATVGLAVENAFLEPTAGKFETMVFIK